jgi:hypothetical protein
LAKTGDGAQLDNSYISEFGRSDFAAAAVAQIKHRCFDRYSVTKQHDQAIAVPSEEATCANSHILPGKCRHSFSGMAPTESTMNGIAELSLAVRLSMLVKASSMAPACHSQGAKGLRMCNSERGNVHGRRGAVQ